MKTRNVQSAACVAILAVCALALHGCGGGKPEIIDGVNTGDPCSVCKSPLAQGPKAGDLNQGDFEVFCNEHCVENGAGKAADTVKDANAEVHESDESPPTCDVCKRPDA